MSLAYCELRAVDDRERNVAKTIHFLRLQEWVRERKRKRDTDRQRDRHRESARDGDRERVQEKCSYFLPFILFFHPLFLAVGYRLE